MSPTHLSVVRSSSRAPRWLARFIRLRAFAVARGAVLTFTLSLVAALLPRAVALEPGIATPAGFRADRVLVRPAANANAAAVEAVHAALGTRVRQSVPGARGVQIIDLPPGLDVARAVARFQQSRLFAFAEPDYLVRPMVAPNDFRYLNQDQWNMNNTGIYGGVAGADISAEAAWDLQHDAQNIIVAVVDTGIRATHEDLAPNLWTNPGETGFDAQGRDRSTNGIDDDGNGYVDDVHGINLLTRTGNPDDDWGHGTHVAGIIGAAGNNGLGVAGVAWKVKLMACKFIDASGNGSISDAILALNYAKTHGARIINASWGGYSFNSTALRDTFASLRDAGIIVTAAAGNDNNDNDVMPLYPASYGFDNMLAVAATDRTDTRAPFSNYGARSVHLAAPGAPAFSTWNGSDSDYRNYDGTSMAAPHLAGACALLWTRFPSDTAQQILQRILTTTDALTSLSARTTTGGRLNLAAALASGSTVPPAPTKQAPVANASATPVSGTAPLTVVFSSQGSTDADGSIVSTIWSFGTGDQSTATNPTYTYTSAGTYTASLTVTDNDGLTSSATVSISVGSAANQPPVALASASPTSGTAPLAVAFSSAGSADPDGTLTAYQWDFGDGSTANTASPAKTYTTPGNFSAQLTVTDNQGATATSSVNIAVAAPAPDTSRDADVRLFTVTTTTNNSGTTALAAVTLRDRLDRPVSGVSVTIEFSGAVSRTSTVLTNSAGECSVSSPKSKRASGPVTVRVTAVTPPAGSAYDPAIYPEPTERTVSF